MVSPLPKVIPSPSKSIGMHAASCDRVVLVFYWTTTDKLKFTDWFWVHQMFGCGKNAILRRRMIACTPPRVN